MAEVVFSDIDVYGRTLASGNTIEHIQDAAISNALVAWFTSKNGDYIYRPDLGGILERTLFKLMTQNRSDDLRSFFRNEIEKNFGNVLDVINVAVTAQKDSRTYSIEIQYVSKLTNKNNLVQFNTVNTLGSTVPKIIEVPFIGENLINFIILKLPDLSGIIMEFDDVTSKWTWGPYRFTNLQDTDYNFNTALNLTVHNA